MTLKHQELKTAEMKMTKKEFKALIKECLRELIQEGELNNLLATPSQPVPQLQLIPQQQPYMQQPYMMQPPSYDLQQPYTPDYSYNMQPQMPNPYTMQLENAVKTGAIAAAGGDPSRQKVFEQIFVNNAVGPLQDMLQAEGKIGLPQIPVSQEEIQEGQQTLNALGAGRWSEIMARSIVKK